MTDQFAHRMVQDPMMTDAEFYHQRSLRPDKPNLGKIHVREKVTTRIGGLAYIRDKLSHHEKAAERFKNLYEAAYGCANPSIDASAVRVDRTIMAHDSGMANRVDNAAVLRDAMKMLGDRDAQAVIAIVVLGAKCADIAALGLAGKPTGRTIGEASRALLNALDRLAIHWCFRSR